MVQTIIDLRHELHRYPELAGREVETATRVRDYFQSLQPDRMIEGLGGNGLAVVFQGFSAGPTVLLRCELDAVPVQEVNALAYRSRRAGCAHKCGHDGHMAILAAVGRGLVERRPARGRVVLLYQPAEENGQGAAAVLADPRFTELRPDFAFALHNLPGYPLGQVVVRSGAFSCASRGMALTLTGKSAHAAQPETGRSPAEAMCALISGCADLPPELKSASDLMMATVVGATLGEKAFGTAPERADIWITLRSDSDAGMEQLVAYAEHLGRQAAAADGLGLEIAYADIFPATINGKRALSLVERSCAPLKLRWIEEPFRWSEDFGRLTANYEGALFGIGAGEMVPDLHNPDYDFPDLLIQPAADLFRRILDHSLTV
jgi:amidohydrolase